jgi:flagellar hook-length control protein FliK
VGDKSLAVKPDGPIANSPPANATASESIPASPQILAPALPSPSTPSAKPNGNTAEPAPQDRAAPAGTDGAPVVSAAQILERPGQTEIRIEMQDHSLGGIQLRAHITGDQIGASIAVEHHDAQVMLTSELPALHTALNEKNLRVDIQSVSQGTMASMNGGLGGDSGYKGFSQAHSKPPDAGQPEAPIAFRDAQAELGNGGSSSVGLSVRA